jgi:soluble lytic murein transglycosylase-like protein
VARTAGEVRQRLTATRGEIAIANEQLERWNRIFAFSNRYNIGAQLAGAIHDIAIDEGIEPELAFRLVKTESEFRERATSHVGAVGLTQVMPGTARFFAKGITREELYQRDTNLRIGFRYLRGLIRENDGDVRMALLVYNRGPVAVARARREGRNPSNGYDRRVLAGYRGDGVVE